MTALIIAADYALALIFINGMLVSRWLGVLTQKETAVGVVIVGTLIANALALNR